MGISRHHVGGNVIPFGGPGIEPGGNGNLSGPELGCGGGGPELGSGVNGNVSFGALPVRSCGPNGSFDFLIGAFPVSGADCIFGSLNGIVKILHWTLGTVD